MTARVAILDDDEGQLELLSFVLGRAGMAVEAFARPARFLEATARSPADAAIVDVQLPGIDGREVIRILRANSETRRMPVIAISAYARTSADIIKGFTLGADDYIGKPVDQELLVVRLQSLLRRAPPSPRAGEPLRWGTLEFALEEGVVREAGKEVSLTRQEQRLLAHFLTNPSRVMTRVMLLDHLWPGKQDAGPRTVDKHVETLRKKLPRFGARLETVVKLGYQFNP